MLKLIIKKIFHIYSEQLYKLDLGNVLYVEPRMKITFEEITLNNYKAVECIRPGNFYSKDFKRMISLGDYGLFICVNNIPIGYGWGKIETSKDYFFYIRECYLCRFFIKPEFRGLNFYPATILQLIQNFQNRGFKTFYIAAESTNIPSLKGLEKVGFVHQKKLYFCRLLKMTLNKYQLGE